MRILFISQLYDPEYSIKGKSLMEYWVSQGHKVEVITTFPNYPLGKVFSGYKLKFKNHEYTNNVKVTRLWSHISHSKSKISRAVTYISFTLMALFYTLTRKNIDVIYTYHPQSTTGLIGILMFKLKGVPFITDVQDLWPDALSATGTKADSLPLRLIDCWCKKVYKTASQIIVLSNGFKEALINRGVDEKKISVVYNWCPEERRIQEVLSKKTNESCMSSSATQFVYAGNMGAAQSLSSIIRAFSNFDKNDVKLTLIGGGVEKAELISLIDKEGIDNVEVKDYVSPDKIFDHLALFDILVIHLKDDPLFRITIPSKTQSSMALAKPLLMAVGGEANNIVSDADCGQIAEPQNEASIVNAVGKLVQQKNEWARLGCNARNYYVSNLSIASHYKKIDVVLNRSVNNYVS
jgi:colanic acid biosynthesis glycosyl transferase WcaI